jgi:hypothetical protein
VHEPTPQSASAQSPPHQAHQWQHPAAQPPPAAVIDPRKRRREPRGFRLCRARSASSRPTCCCAATSSRRAAPSSCCSPAACCSSPAMCSSRSAACCSSPALCCSRSAASCSSAALCCSRSVACCSRSRLPLGAGAAQKNPQLDQAFRILEPGEPCRILPHPQRPRLLAPARSEVQHGRLGAARGARAGTSARFQRSQSASRWRLTSQPPMARATSTRTLTEAIGFELNVASRARWPGKPQSEPNHSSVSSG